ncbi:JmjC domain-containing protein [Streptomyces pathocidini]|uniref:JmjC domain-containing protein n=1 Tax=Streptomyces pathocidini TaxID=1650571 RepID=A0ABW7USE9_9ACTN|nr:cupin domain-containing protein [Streptomyces pathocidini]
MSLHLLLDEDGMTDLMTSWPDAPRVYERGVTDLDRVITAEFLYEYVDSGCVPASEIAVVKAPNPSLNAAAFMTNGRTDPAKLRQLHDKGFTIRLGNLQRVIPVLASVSRGIQEQTGYSNYVHAFLTPPGAQGLRHHWDQQMAVIVQVAGVKRWQLWRPPVEAPMREFNESWRVWKEEYIPQWEAAGPDIEIDLEAGQSLLLPRGWVHNPLVEETGQPSVHLTYALRERTLVWLAEQLIAGAIREPEFRRIVRPGDISGPALADWLHDTRDALMKYLGGLDVDALAGTVRRAAVTELEYTT